MEKFASTEQSSIAFICKKLAGSRRAENQHYDANRKPREQLKGTKLPGFFPAVTSTALLPLPMFDVTYDDRWFFNRLMSPLLARGV